MFLRNALAAWPCGVEGKLRFAARGAWQHGPAAWRENSVLLRNALATWPCGVEGKLCFVRWGRGEKQGIFHSKLYYLEK